MNFVRWGIIGCGSVTEVKSGPAFQKVPNSQLVAVCRRSAGLAKDYATRHNVPKWHDNPEDLINDPEVDAIYVATPPNSHKEYTIRAAHAGKPVYVEKPMALSWDECQEMIAACREANVPLLVAYYRRRLPRFLFIEQLLKQLGNIQFVRVLLVRGNESRYQDPNNIPWTVDPHVSGGGLFVDLGSHTLDILDYLLGPINEVRGFADNLLGAYPAEDCVALSLKFNCGAVGVGIWNFCSYGRRDEVEIAGDKGSITFATFGDGPIELTLDGKEKEVFNLTNPAHIQQPLIETVTAHVLGKQLCPSTGTSAARTQWVIDQALNNYRRSRMS